MPKGQFLACARPSERDMLSDALDTMWATAKAEAYREALVWAYNAATEDGVSFEQWKQKMNEKIAAPHAVLSALEEKQ